MLDTFQTWVTDHGALVGFIAAAIAILEFTLKPIRSLFSRFKKPETVRLDPDTVKDLREDPASPPKMHVVQFIAMRRELKADLEQELAEAHEDEKATLSAKIAELENQLADPDKAFAEMQARIRDLEALLDRSGNEIGGDRLAEARAALEAGDFSIADDLFAEIEERRALEVQEAARAAFGRGEIAEEEIRWADAARHYARAARLNESFETLRKASEFTWRSGDYKAAHRFSEELVTQARTNETEERLATALNEHAINSRQLGRYPEAESLFREALEIDAKTIGTAHPEYAKHLNNLAHVVQAQGRYSEAEGLFREALEIGAKTIGTAHPDYATRLNNLATVLVKLDRAGEARPLFEQALEIFRATLPPEHPHIAWVQEHIAILPDP